MSELPFICDGDIDPAFSAGLEALSALSGASGFGVVLVTQDNQEHRFANRSMPRPSLGDGFPAGRVIASFENGDVFRRADVVFHAGPDVSSEAELAILTRAVEFLSDIERLALECSGTTAPRSAFPDTSSAFLASDGLSSDGPHALNNLVYP